MQTLLAIGIVLIPLVLAVIVARIYNVIFGLYAYLFGAILLVAGAELVPSFGNLMVRSINYNSFNAALVNFLFRNTFDRLSFINKLSWKLYLEVGIFALVFIIFWAISGAIRRGRKARRINKYSNVRIVQPRY